MSRDGQLPLFHLVYEGDRPDVRLFPEVLTSVRTRVERVFGAAPPPTLVYDKGNVSRATQAQVSALGLHYVSSLVPSQHPALLAEALPRLAPVALPSGDVVQAYRTRQRLWGQERTVSNGGWPRSYGASTGGCSTSTSWRKAAAGGSRPTSMPTSTAA